MEKKGIYDIPHVKKDEAIEFAALRDGKKVAYVIRSTRGIDLEVAEAVVFGYSIGRSWFLKFTKGADKIQIVPKDEREEVKSELAGILRSFGQRVDRVSFYEHES